MEFYVVSQRQKNIAGVGHDTLVLFLVMFGNISTNDIYSSLKDHT